MSYEDTIKAKHAFQDSFSEFLSYLSVMTYREIEMTAARLADSISNNDIKINRESAMFSGEVIQIVLHLRDKGDFTDSKIKRFLMKTKKKELIKKAAVIEQFPILLAYEEELKKVMAIRERQNTNNKKALFAWRNERNKLSFWKRIFMSPPSPERHLTSFPVSPQPIHIYEKLLSNKWDFSQLLIYTASHYSFTSIEQSTNFANEESVKSISIKLLESK